MAMHTSMLLLALVLVGDIQALKNGQTFLSQEPQLSELEYKQLSGDGLVDASEANQQDQDQDQDDQDQDDEDQDQDVQETTPTEDHLDQQDFATQMANFLRHKQEAEKPAKTKLTSPRGHKFVSKQVFFDRVADVLTCRKLEGEVKVVCGGAPLYRAIHQFSGSVNR